MDKEKVKQALAIISSAIYTADPFGDDVENLRQALLFQAEFIQHRKKMIKEIRDVA